MRSSDSWPVPSAGGVWTGTWVMGVRGDAEERSDDAGGPLVGRLHRTVPPLPCRASPPRRGGGCWRAPFAPLRGSWSPKTSCIPGPQWDLASHTDDKPWIQVQRRRPNIMGIRYTDEALRPESTARPLLSSILGVLPSQLQARPLQYRQARPCSRCSVHRRWWHSRDRKSVV